LLLGALLVIPAIAQGQTKLRASFADIPRTEVNSWRNLIATLGKSESEMARFIDMSLLDELQREGFFDRVGK
jgi:hypothetical protein